MFNFFLIIFLGSICIGILKAIFESSKIPICNVNTLFYNSPEENQRQQNIIRLNCFLISLLSNASDGSFGTAHQLHGSILMPRDAPRLRLRLADDIKVAPDSQILLSTTPRMRKHLR